MSDRPPLPIGKSPLRLPGGSMEVDAHGFIVGTAVRQCHDHVHVFAEYGYCQCGTEFWESPVPDSLAKEDTDD